MSSETKTSPTRGVLVSGGIAAILASSCCLGPLVLISLGISGAWLSYLTVLEPYRLWFVGASALALAFAFRRVWRPRVACEDGTLCAVPAVSRTYKIIYVVIAILLLIGLTFPMIAPLFY
jgi:mercuric ion transport protein